MVLLTIAMTTTSINTPLYSQQYLYVTLIDHVEAY